MSNQQSPTELMFWDAHQIRQIDGFWYLVKSADHMAAFRSRFQPRSDDIVLTTFRKTGTTWLKALCYNILDKEQDQDLLAMKNPHEVVPTLENTFLEDRVQDILLRFPPAGRLLHTHLPYSYLPEAVTDSRCKIVYLARNPKDTVVSMWHFYNKLFKSGPGDEPYPLEGAVESFCTGIMPFGPFYEHVVGYWEESRRRPQEVLFLKYEDLWREPKEQVRKLASFLGKPFAQLEDGDGELGKVLWRSSLERLKELEVNKYGIGELNHVLNSTFFRQGTVRDWENYLIPQMAQRIDQLTQSKLQGTELSLDD
ncbi:unnamed protein product [Linum tenue]|uniref:Sulfotransferase n=1 Tax=Linum tenue TaxID=586396 RepID=A0AAV0RKC6_9ROSI|nr:unnamed protein product [Linum tenue]